MDGGNWLSTVIISLMFYEGIVGDQHEVYLGHVVTSNRNLRCLGQIHQQIFSGNQRGYVEISTCAEVPCQMCSHFLNRFF